MAKILVTAGILFILISMIIPSCKSSCEGKSSPGLINACYESEASKGDLEAQYKLAERFLGADGIEVDENQAVKWFKIAAENGHSDAQRRLGNAYSLGVGGVPLDVNLAKYWWEKSANAGNIKSQLLLGEHYDKGEILKKDYPKAAYWYLKAAIAGDHHAQSIIGSFYSVGRAVPKDPVLAAAWFNLAAKDGDSDYTAERENHAKNLSAEDLMKARKLADSWQIGENLAY